MYIELSRWDEKFTVGYTTWRGMVGELERVGWDPNLNTGIPGASRADRIGAAARVMNAVFDVRAARELAASLRAARAAADLARSLRETTLPQQGLPLQRARLPEGLEPSTKLSIARFAEGGPFTLTRYIELRVHDEGPMNLFRVHEIDARNFCMLQELAHVVKGWLPNEPVNWLAPLLVPAWEARFGAEPDLHGDLDERFATADADYPLGRDADLSLARAVRKALGECSNADLVRPAIKAFWSAEDDFSNLWWGMVPDAVQLAARDWFSEESHRVTAKRFVSVVRRYKELYVL